VFRDAFNFLGEGAAAETIDYCCGIG